MSAEKEKSGNLTSGYLARVELQFRCGIKKPLLEVTEGKVVAVFSERVKASTIVRQFGEWGFERSSSYEKRFSC